MSAAEAAVLAAAAFAAGAINAVAGGGTILTFPALLAWGMPAIEANATSTFALVAGTAGSAWAYRRQIHSIGSHLPRLGAVSVAGGLVGAWLLARTPEALFRGLVPWLLLLATLLFAGQGAPRRSSSHTPIPRPKSALLAQFLVSIYGGYFGAGIGILMLATFAAIMGMADIHRMNALKTLLAAAINSVAALYFAAEGLIRWPQASLMTVAALAGYYMAARAALQIPPSAIRTAVVGAGAVLTILAFLGSFRG